MNDKIVDFLEMLVFSNINNSVLTHPIDYKILIDGFRELVEEEIDYNIDEIRSWLYFHQQENLLGDSVIEEIVKIADYVQIDS